MLKSVKYVSVGVVLILATLLSGCKKADLNPKGTMTAKVGVIDWIGNNGLQVIKTKNGRCIIAASSAKNQNLGIYFTRTTVGTDSLKKGDNYATFYHPDSKITYETQNDNIFVGAVNISKFDESAKQVSGTFEYKALNPAQSSLAASKKDDWFWVKGEFTDLDLVIQ